MKYITILAIILTTIACKNTEKVTTEKEEQAPIETKVTEQKDIVYDGDVEVVFISKGEGISHYFQSNIDHIIKSFQRFNEVEIKIQKEYWGREGEVNYHLDLENLSTAQKKELIRLINQTTEGSDMVKVIEKQ